MIKEDLSTWFDDSKGGGTWVDISRTNDDGEHPECGENTDRQGKAKCVPKKKAKQLSKKEKDRLVRRKRKKDTDSQSPDNASSDPSDQRKSESAMRSITEDEENEPKDEDLWQDVLAVTKGEKDSVSANGETVEAPNDGDGFDVYPCVPLDSQALTREGWKAHDRIEVGDEILAYDIDEDELSWSEVEDKHRFEDAPIKRMSKDMVNFDVRCTPGHKWVAFRKNKFEDRRLIKTSELPTSYNLLTSAKLSEDVGGDSLENFSKSDSWTERLLNMSKEQAEAFFASAVVYDGSEQDRKTTRTFGGSQVDPDHSEAIRLSAVLSGYQVSSGERVYENADGKQTRNTFTFMERRHQGLQNMHVEDDGKEDVWCPQTEHGTWVMRQGSTVTITGNSAYANGWATKMYNKLGGEWKTVDENVTKKAIKLGLMGEDLDQWFEEEWVDISETDEDGNHPPCGETHDTPERMENPEENYPKCVPKSKAKDMTEKEKEEMVKKKQQSVNQDDADQDSDDGDSDEPTYTSSDPDEHFSKQKQTTMKESTLRSIIREEIKEARVGRNQNMADTDYPEIVKRTKALMNRPVVDINTSRGGDVHVMKFQGSMRSGISIAAFEQKGIQITSVSYEDGIITLRVRNR
jgi:hypothetical protein